MSSEITAKVKKLGLDPATAIVDSTLDIEIMVRASDIMHAKQNNKKECVMARALCKAIPDASDVFMYRMAAWVHQVNDDGTERFVRFKPAPETQRAIERFDKDGTWVPGKYKLLAPKGSNTLKAIALRSKKRPGRHQPAKKKTPTTRAIKVRTRSNWEKGAG